MEPVVILRSPRSTSSVPAALAASGEWDVIDVPDLRALAQVSADRAVAARVGLVVLDPLDAFDPRELGEAMSRWDLEWFAILAREGLGQPAIASFVVTACHDFHTLPVDAERLGVVLQHALVRSRLAREYALTAEASEGRFGMLGLSPAMQTLYRDIEKIVRDDSPVMITGESGTGKEKAARALHDYSERRAGPFVAVNCAALPAQLVQSELFGHEKGAFTGAFQRHIGCIESAAGGLIFLDEIGDLPLDQQANLLRFLQERVIVRVGSSRPIKVDVRVIAATNVDLPARIAEGRFREDLYYRLNVLQLKVPALRDRGADIELIASSCLRRFVATHRRRVRGFSATALSAMMNYDWPGNVRDLINRVQKAVIMSESRLVTPADLGLEEVAAARARPTLSSARKALERDVIERTLARNLGNVSAAARELGVARVTLYRLMDRLKASGSPDSRARQ